MVRTSTLDNSQVYRPTRLQCALAYLRNGDLPPLALLSVRGWWLDARLRLARRLLDGVRRDMEVAR